MSIQIIYPKDARREPERCQILINGRPLFEDRRFVKRGPSPVTPEGVAISPNRVLAAFLHSVREICERVKSECVLGPPSILLEIVMHEDQRIQIKVRPGADAKSFTALKEEWTDTPRFTIDVFSGTDRCLGEGWSGWQGSPDHAELKALRKSAERAYWAFLEKRRGKYDVADDKRPTQGAGPRDVDRPAEPC